MLKLIFTVGGNYVWQQYNISLVCGGMALDNKGNIIKYWSALDMFNIPVCPFGHEEDLKIDDKGKTIRRTYRIEPGLGIDFSYYTKKDIQEKENIEYIVYLGVFNHKSIIKSDKEILVPCATIKCKYDGKYIKDSTRIFPYSYVLDKYCSNTIHNIDFKVLRKTLRKDHDDLEKTIENLINERGGSISTSLIKEINNLLIRNNHFQFLKGNIIEEAFITSLYNL
jgi:hypothetical protein